MVAAPKDGRPTTRINRMLRQLAGAKDDVLIEVRYPNQKEPTSCALKDARAKPDRLLYAADLKRDPMSFRITMSLGVEAADLGVLPIRRARTPPWAPVAPKLPAAAPQSTPTASDEPPAFSGGDREFGEAVDPKG